MDAECVERVYIIGQSRCSSDVSILAQIICADVHVSKTCGESVCKYRVDEILMSISAQIICVDVVVHGCKICVYGKLQVGFNFNV